MKLYLEKIIISLVVLCLSLLMRYLAYTQIKEASLAGLSPQAVPVMVSWCVTILSVIVFNQAIWLRIKEKRTGKTAFSSVHFQFFPFLMFLLMLLYAIGIVYMGYFLSSFIILPLIMYTLQIHKLRSYLTMSALVIFIYIIIDLLLKIPLPKMGIWGVL